MHFLLLLLAVVGSAVAAPQFAPQFAPRFAPNSFSPSTGLAAPPPTSFNPQTFAAVTPPQNTRSFAPTFTPHAAAIVPGRRFQLDSAAFTPDRSTFQSAHVPYVINRSEYLNDNGEFGSSVEQSNGARFSETGSLKRTNDGLDNVVTKTGSFSYTSPEGIPVSVTYTADEYGFHPVSANIPVSVQPLTPTF